LKGLDQGYLEILFWRVSAWTISPYRLGQIADPDIRELRPYVEIVAGEDCCDKAKALTGQWLKHDGLERLPLAGCWQACWCAYRTRSPRDLARAGRLPSIDNVD